QILVVEIGGQSSEHALPDAGMAPAAEALMHRFPLAVSLPQGAPVCTPPQNPPKSVDEQTVIRRPTSPGPRFPPRRWAKPPPIGPRSAHIASPLSSAPCRITELYESAIKPLGNPECRSALGRDDCRDRLRSPPKPRRQHVALRGILPACRRLHVADRREIAL